MHDSGLQYEAINDHLSELRRKMALQRECAQPHPWRWLLARARRLETWLERRALLERGQDEARWARESSGNF